ncbi:MAG: hypothetical protein OEM79_05185 [Nitrosopumilus sp.]|nr:hypothetical protein [Nitrosopumilus sp.]
MTNKNNVKNIILAIGYQIIAKIPKNFYPDIDIFNFLIILKSKFNNFLTREAVYA